MSAVSRRGPLLLFGMALGLTLFYLSPIPFVVRLHGLLLFSVLALLRPDLALLFVPLTAPLYLIPATLGGLRDRETLLPLHEVALLATAFALVCRWLWQLVMRRSSPTDANAIPSMRLNRQTLRQALPALLLLLCGIWGVVIALPGARGEALREFRWLIVEPLIFFGILLLYGRAAQTGSAIALVLAGAAVASIGLLQFVGVDLVPLIGQKRSFSENIVDVGLARRVASVYGHPNNLGLFLGRVWPLAVVLCLSRVGSATSARPGLLSALRRPRTIWSFQIQPLYALAALLCLGGLFVSFSRGAWLGAAVAGLVLVAGLAYRRTSTRRSFIPGRVLLVGGILLVLLVSLALTLRGGGGSEQTRLLLWREAAGYIQQHPLGIGLDQFYAYHAPDSGRSLIDPQLVGTSEQYAAHPHNLLLDIWLRLGPFGLLAFGWLIIRCVRGSLAALSQPTGDLLVLGALAGLAAALVHGLVDQFYFVPDVAYAFWVLLVLGAAGTLEAGVDHP